MTILAHSKCQVVGANSVAETNSVSQATTQKSRDGELLVLDDEGEGEQGKIKWKDSEAWNLLYKLFKDNTIDDDDMEPKMVDPTLCTSPAVVCLLLFALTTRPIPANNDLTGCVTSQVGNILEDERRK